MAKSSRYEEIDASDIVKVRLATENRYLDCEESDTHTIVRFFIASIETKNPSKAFSSASCLAYTIKLRLHVMLCQGFLESPVGREQVILKRVKDRVEVKLEYRAWLEMCISLHFALNQRTLVLPKALATSQSLIKASLAA